MRIFLIAFIFFTLVFKNASAHDVLILKDDSGESSIPIVVDHDHLELNPLNISFGEVAVGSTRFRPLEVINLSNKKLEVRLRSTNEYFYTEGITFGEDLSFELDRAGEEGASKLLEIGFTPSSLEEENSGELIFESNEIGTNSIKNDIVSVSGTSVESPSIRIISSDTGDPLFNVDFGEIQLGQHTYESFVIFNDGPTDIENALLEGVSNDGCFNLNTHNKLCIQQVVDGNILPMPFFSLPAGEHLVGRIRIEALHDLQVINKDFSIHGAQSPWEINVRAEIIQPEEAGYIKVTNLNNHEIDGLDMFDVEPNDVSPIVKKFKIRNVGDKRVRVTIDGLGVNSCIVEEEYSNKCFRKDGNIAINDFVLDGNKSIIIHADWYYSPNEFDTSSHLLNISTHIGQEIPFYVNTQINSGKALTLPQSTEGILGFEDRFGTTRGLFAKNAFFSDTNIDSISKINGALAVNIPVGGTYKIGPNFNYGLNLSYNSNGWSRRSLGEYGEWIGHFRSHTFTVPVKSNAGLGWNLSLGGELYVHSPKFGGGVPEWPNNHPVQVWNYVDETGSVIGFVPRGSSVNSHDTYYSTKGHIRLVGDPNDDQIISVELGNGITKYFSRYSEGCPAVKNSQSYCFRITKIEDQHENYVRMNYLSNGKVEIWMRSNGEEENSQRQIIVKFNRTTVLEPEEYVLDRETIREYVDYVEVPTFDNDPGNDNNPPKSRWNFVFENDNSIGGDSISRIFRSCPGDYGLLDWKFSHAKVPILKKVELPNSTNNGFYEFTTMVSNTIDQQKGCDSDAGTLQQINTPAGGSIYYEYAGVFTPTPCSGGSEEPLVNHLLGIGRREVSNKNGDRIKTQQFHYELLDRGSPPYEQGNGDSNTTPEDVCARSNTTKTNIVTLDKIPGELEYPYLHEVYYHTVTTSEYNLPEGGQWDVSEYGLPITKLDSLRGGLKNGSNPYLSSLQAVCNTNNAAISEIDIDNHCKVKSKAYLNYITKSYLPSANCNITGSSYCFSIVSEPFNSRVVYPVDIEENSKYTNEVYSEYDGLGHFRKKEVYTNFPGVDYTSAHTNYNPHIAHLEINNSNVVIDNLPHWNPNEYEWVIHNYNFMVENPDGANFGRRTNYEFELNGLLKCQRTLKTLGQTPVGDGILNASDIAETYFYENGFLVKQYTSGGDKNNIAPSINGCPTNPAEVEYIQKNTYKHGSLESSAYLEFSEGMERQFGSKITENTIDDGTGFIRRECDNSISPALCKDYEYDAVRRLTKIVPNAGLKTTIEYDVDENEVKIKKMTQANELVSQTSHIYNGIGQEVAIVDKVSTQRADSGSVIQIKQYHPQGMIANYSTLMDRNKRNLLSEDAKQSTRYTYNVYDYRNQPRSFLNPLNERFNINYPDIHIAGLSFSGTADKTQLRQDYLGRTVSTIEKRGNLDTRKTDVSYSNGKKITTRIDLLSSPQTSQVRTLSYDGRGVLVSETVPELSEINYFKYDSKGNLIQKIGNGAVTERAYNKAGQETNTYGDGRLITSLVWNHNRQLIKSTKYHYITSQNTGGLINRLLHNDSYMKVFRVTDHNKEINSLGLTTKMVTSVSSSEVQNYDQLNFECSFDPDTSDPTCSNQFPTLEAEFESQWEYDDSGRDVSISPAKCIDGFVCGQFANFDAEYKILKEFDLKELVSIDLLKDGDLKDLMEFSYHESGSVKKVTKRNLNGDIEGYQQNDQLIHRSAVSGDPNLYVDRIESIKFFDVGNDEDEVVWDSGIYQYNGKGKISKIGSRNFLYDDYERLISDDVDTFEYDAFDNIISGTEWTVNSDIQSNRMLSINIDGQVNFPEYDTSGNVSRVGCYHIYYDSLEKQISWYCNEGVNKYRALYLSATDGRRVVTIDLIGGDQNGIGGNFDVIMTPNAIRSFKLGHDSKQVKTYVSGESIIINTLSDTSLFDEELIHLTKNHLQSVVVAGNSEDWNVDSYSSYGVKDDNFNEAIDEFMSFASHRSDKNLVQSEETKEGFGLTTYTPTRTYGQVIGRMIQPDPARDGWNLYAYSGNDPINNYDPLGLRAHAHDTSLVSLSPEAINKLRVYQAEMNDASSSVFNSRLKNFSLRLSAAAAGALATMGGGDPFQAVGVFGVGRSIASGIVRDRTAAKLTDELLFEGLNGPRIMEIGDKASGAINPLMGPTGGKLWDTADGFKDFMINYDLPYIQKMKDTGVKFRNLGGGDGTVAEQILLDEGMEAAVQYINKVAR